MALKKQMADRPDYGSEKASIKEFIETFVEQGYHALKYLDQVQKIINKESTVFTVELDDVDEYNSALAESVEGNTMRYISLFSKAIDAIQLPPTRNNIGMDVFDVLQDHRRQLVEESANREGQDTNPGDIDNKFPEELLRRYEVHIVPRSHFKAASLRTVGAEHVGSLVNISGIVTRVSDVRPLVTVATYTCDVCGNEIYQTVASKDFTPLRQCPSQRCRLNNSAGNLNLQTRGCKFQKFQEVKLQELPDQVPVGTVPRSITCHVHGSLTRSISAGNEVSLTGVFLPVRYSGFQRARAGLVTDTFVHTLSIRLAKKTYSEYQSEISEAEIQEFRELSQSSDVISKLARSIAPEIYGHEDVKTAILFLLTSGVTKEKLGGLRIRGDINVLLMGDPGVAKSQLLKQAATIAPRGVYTTGKGSSGVGLTAAVLRDPVTKEMILEGGALVLADKGVCCIDEFDKMEDGDRTAIHEVMEQQTVSIAKAGVTTSLNARTSILAAANPLYGRYRPELSPEKNINLQPALLSRFDLIFLLRDVPDLESDRQLANHILFVHQHGKHPEIRFEPFKSQFLRKYISAARAHEPSVPRELTNFIMEAYVQMRKDGYDDDRDELPCTPRVLLSILRVCQARARLRFADEVDQQDVDEAIRLMTESTKSTKIAGKSRRSRQDETSAIWDIIKSYSLSVSSKNLDRDGVLNHIRMKGFSQAQFQKTLGVYEDLNVLKASRRNITLL